MMAQVPRATLIIANPTHYAIALRYEQGETVAPICLAKGGASASTLTAGAFAAGPAARLSSSAMPMSMTLGT